MVGFGGDTSDGAGFCGVFIGCPTVVLNLFDTQGRDVVCVLTRSHSEVCIVTPSKCFVGTFYE